MNKAEILDGIKAMSMTEKDYDVLLGLCDSLSDEIFSKVIELILEGDLLISDFEPLLEDGESRKVVSESIAAQRSLYESASKLAAFREESGTGDDAIYQEYAIAKGDASYSDEKEKELSDILSSLAYGSGSSDPVTQACRARLYKDLMDGGVSEDEARHWMMSLDDFMVPVDWSNVRLNGYDLDFMRSKGLTEDMMKKIKAVAERIRMPAREGAR
jgi:hypothetical protein